MAVLVGGLREDDDGAAGFQHLGGTVVEGQVAADIVAVAVAGAEGGHDFQETQDAGHAVLLKDVAARDEDGLPAVLEHRVEDGQRVHKAVLVVGDDDGGLPFGRYVLLVQNIEMTIVDVVVRHAQIVHVQVVQPVILVYFVKGNHTEQGFYSTIVISSIRFFALANLSTMKRK